MAAVGETWHLVLPTELAFALEPAEEESLRSNVYRERKEGHILIALGIVVGVQRAQSSIEVRGKYREITGRLLELNEPLMAALPFVEEEAWRCRVFAHACTAITTAGSLSAASVLATITSSPKALMKCFVRPVMTMR